MADLWQAARGQMAGAEWQAAAATLARICEADPGDAAAWVQMSYCALRCDRPRQAREAVLRGVALEPRDHDTVATAIPLLAALNLGAALVACVDGLGALDRIPVRLLMTIAHHFSLLGDQARALKYLDEVHRADPEFPPGLLARAQALMYFGRTQDSRRDLDRCLARAPEIAQAHWLRSQLGGQGASARHADELRGRLARAGAKPLDEAFLGFALHAELDRLGDHAGAWQALEQACRAKRGLLHYDPAANRRLFDALIAMPPARESDAAAVPDAPVPIFVVGMHRSGTTLLEQLLDASPQVRGAGELYDFTSAMRHATDHHCRGVIDQVVVDRARDLDYADVGRRYLDGMAWRLGDEPCFVDKLPSNFLNIGFICRALPRARILHMVRDPMETCFSNLRELFSDANPHSYDQRELVEHFGQYRRLMAHWHAAYPGRILDVPYAGLTGGTEAVMREVAAFCGVDYLPAMQDPRNSRRAVATASAVQVRDRVLRREAPKWAPYASRLQPMSSALRAMGIGFVEPGPTTA